MDEKDIKEEKTGFLTDDVTSVILEPVDYEDDFYIINRIQKQLLKKSLIKTDNEEREKTQSKRWFFNI